MQQQQIYTHSDEHFEVYTTVFSPQVCRSRTRTRHVAADKVVALVDYQARWPKELGLSRGDRVHVLFKEDEVWWFGRLKNGQEGYFPAACVEPLQASGESSRATPTLQRRGSVPAAALTTGAPCGCTSGHSTPKLLRKNSVRRPLGLEGPPAGSPAPRGSPSLLHRVLAKSRRKSCPHLPHLPHPPVDIGSVNTGFQPD